MTKTVISVEHLTKQYDLGVIGTGTLTRDINRWWARLRGKPDPYITIGHEHRSKHQGETILALDDVSFTVKQGQALGIIGANGAGKSTLLKLLSRVTAPTSGVIKMKGRIGSLLEVGTGFHGELTGRENVYLNGAILGMRKEEVDRKFDEIVDFSGVEQFIDTPVKRYSSGMYVRLGFAVAAHLDPEILIVDEVLAVGDADFQRKCLGKMNDVADEGRTVLFVSHNMSSIKQLCEQGIYLSGGEINFEGKIEECIDRYLNIKQMTSKRIIDHITRIDERIKLHQILINGSDLDICRLKEGETKINVKLFGHLAESLPLDLEMHIKDMYGNVLGFFSPGHLRGYTNNVKAGDFELNWAVHLPEKMTKGDYYLDIAFTDPDKMKWATLENAFRLSYEGTRLGSGRYVDYNSGAGWIIL